MATSGSSDCPLLETVKSREDILGNVHSNASTAIEMEAGINPF